MDSYKVEIDELINKGLKKLVDSVKGDSGNLDYNYYIPSGIKKSLLHDNWLYLSEKCRKSHFLMKINSETYEINCIWNHVNKNKRVTVLIGNDDITLDDDRICIQLLYNIYKE